MHGGSLEITLTVLFMSKICPLPVDWMNACKLSDFHQSIEFSQAELIKRKALHFMGSGCRGGGKGCAGGGGEGKD